MTDTSSAVRTAAARLSPRERRAMAHQLGTSAEVWRAALPRVCAFWEAVRDLVAEIDDLERARATAETSPQTMRSARR